MAWVTPSGRSTGEIVTAAIWNQDVVDNPRYLKGLDGNVQLEDRVAFDGDAAFYTEILASNPVVNLDTGDYLEYDRATNVLKLLIASTLEATLRGTGLLLPSGSHLEYAGSKYAVVTTLGSDYLIGAGAASHTHDVGGAVESTVVNTGFSTELKSFACSLDGAGSIEQRKVNLSAPNATVYLYDDSAETVYINWIAIGKP